MSDDPVLAAIGLLDTKLDASLGHLDTRFDALAIRHDASFARLEAAIDGVRRDARSDLTELRVAMMGRMDRLQDTVTEIRDDIGVAMGAADAMQRANDNTRELVRLQGQQLTIMFRQIKRLEEKVRGITGDP
jgi:methyl-accepting chemotaxis protein